MGKKNDLFLLNLSNKIKAMFIKEKRSSKLVNIRKVHFGLRIRFLGMLTLVIIVIISILTIIMYINQRNLLEEEKNSKAVTLAKILGGPATFYLDKNIETSDEELKIKYQIIAREAINFKKYNDDIFKIFLTNSHARVRYSTDKNDVGHISAFDPIKKSLTQKEGSFISTDFDVEKKDKKSKSVKKEEYRAITYPIFLQKGLLVDVSKDYKKYYHDYKKSAKGRKRIYLRLWKKYKEYLSQEFDPNLHEKGSSIDREIVKAWDIDFLFLQLFKEARKFRNVQVAKGKRNSWSENWFVRQKRIKAEAYKNDEAGKAKKVNDAVIKRLEDLAAQVDEFRRVGALAIVFNIGKIKSELDKNISAVFNIALLMIIISAVSFLFVLNFMIKNLKKLEKWAVTVSEGNIYSKINIDTDDEIGRLGDLFNYMIDEICVKYHLEKYVSKSTRSMLKQKKPKKESLELGGNARKKLAFIFADVRGFTSFSEQNDPEIVIEVLNFYLELQSKVIKANSGDIADYVGDEVMAQFSGERRADNALTTAVKIIKEIDKANAERTKNGLPIFEVGIGVHGGDVVVGNIGSTFRMDFACVGDAVNLSARLCSSAGPGEILVSKELAAQTKRKYVFKKTPSIAVKGKVKKIPIFRVTT